MTVTTSQQERFAMGTDKKSNQASGTTRPGEDDAVIANVDSSGAAQPELSIPDAQGRREFLGKSGKLMIYVPPLIQLFIPTKALAASPSS